MIQRKSRKSRCTRISTHISSSISQDLNPSQLRPGLWHSQDAIIENSVFIGALLPYNLSSVPQPQEVWSLQLVINHSRPFLSFSSRSYPSPLALNYHFPWTSGCPGCCTLQLFLFCWHPFSVCHCWKFYSLHCYLLRASSEGFLLPVSQQVTQLQNLILESAS